MFKSPKQQQIKLYKKIVFLICLIPLFRLIYLGFQDELGANPIEFLEHSTGYWALFILLTSLSLTPIRLLTKTAWIMQFRRMLGLYMFFYASLHLTVYTFLDYGFFWEDMIDDIIKHPYIIVGMIGFILSIPLALTSTNKMVKRLGKRWKTLHKSVYLIAVLAVLHFLWLVKKDMSEPLIFAFVLGFLFAVRWYYQPNSILQSVLSALLNKESKTINT